MIFVAGMDGSLKLFDLKSARPLSIIIPSEDGQELVNRGTKYFVYSRRSNSDHESIGNIVISATRSHIGLQLFDMDPVVAYWLM